MTFENRLSAFVKLGGFLNEQLHLPNAEFKAVIRQTNHENAWFTEDNIRFALNAVAEDLHQHNLLEWTANYPHLHSPISSKTIAVIMPGNIPLVGFRDFLTTLVCGHKILCKLSSKDRVLLPYLAQKLIEIEPEFSGFICFEEHVIKGFDAIIATGGSSAVEHFRSYFSNYPHVIRGHRNSCAILDGHETTEELQNLFEDMFRYFGLGCRNVTKIFIPYNYDFQEFTKAAKNHSELFQVLEQHHLYQSNYQYQTVVSALNMRKIIDTGVFTLIENSTLTPPISIIHYEYYHDFHCVKENLRKQSEQLQCIVSHCDIPFGKAQTPQLSDYADGIDTVFFLMNLASSTGV